MRIIQRGLVVGSVLICTLLGAIAACTGDDPAAFADDAGAMAADAPSADTDAGGSGDALVDGAASRQFSSVAMGEVSACAAAAKDGSTWCWGANAFGGLGDPDLQAMRARAARVIMPPAAGFVAIAGGYSHTCGLTADGAVWCWGLNNHGQLGHDPTTDPACTGGLRCSAKPQQVLGLVASSVVGLEFATCALSTSGDAYCWGFGEDGILGEAKADGGAPTAGSESFVPVKILGLPSAQVKALGAARWPGHTACVALANGEVRCWGENPWGGLGHSPGAGGDRTAATLPHCNPCNPVPTIVEKTLSDGGKTPLSEVRAVVGGYTSCALVGASQNLDCWGANFCSQIDAMNPEAGAGTFSAEPHRRVDDSASSIGVGDFMCDRLLNGQVKCWGSDGTGVVGATVDGGACKTDDGLDVPAAPTPRAQDVIVDSLDVGHFAVVAVDKDGHVIAWGRNEFGQLGHPVGTNGDDPQQHDRNTKPQRVEGLDDP